MPGTRVGALDIQFGPNYEQPKLNQLVQSTQQVIQAVNSAWSAITALQAAGGSGGGPVTVPVHGLVSNRHTVSGLQAGQVLLATAPTAFGFDFLKLEQLAKTDGPSIVAAAEGDVLTFHDGFWSAEPAASFGLGDPGANALVMWNEAAAAFAWAIPVAGAGISLIPGQIAVNDFELTHGHLLGLLADDHPQYALIGAANTWSFLQTFQAGAVINLGLTLTGNLEQSGAEPEWFMRNTDDAADEGAWRTHAEPGMLIFSSVNDDGSDGENWLSASRIGGLVDAVNISSNSLTWNGAQLLTTDYVPPAASPIFGQPIFVTQGLTVTGIEPAFTFGDTQSAADEGYWQLHAEPGQLIWSTLTDDGITWGDSWLTVSRSSERVESIALSADSLTWNGDTVLTASSLAAGANVYFSTNAAGQLVVNASAGTGGGGAVSSVTGTANQVTATPTTGAVVLTLPQQLVIPNATSGIGVTASASAGGQAAQFSAPSGGSGVIIAAGALSTDASFRVLNAVASANYFEIFGDGHGFLTPPTGGLSWNTAGNFVFAAPASGDALTINQVTGSEGIRVVATAATPSIIARNNTNGFQIEMGITTAAVYLDASNATSGLALTTQGSGNVRVAIGNAGNIVMNAATSGVTLTVGTATTGVTNATIGALNIAVGQVFSAGSAEIFPAASTSLNIGTTTAGTTTTLWASGLNAITIAANGEVTLGAATTGVVQLNVLGPGGSGPAVTFPDTAAYTSFTGGLMRFGVGIAFSVGEAEIITTGTTRLGIGTVGAATLTFYTNSLTAATVNSGQQWNFPATTSGPTITVTGAANVFAGAFVGSNTSSQSFGLTVHAGTNGTDVALQINNAANSLAYFAVQGNGSAVVGNPTSGGLGIGTLNATGLFVNGVAVSTTAGLTEFANSVTTAQTFASSTTLTAITGLTLGTIPLGNYQIWITMVVSEATASLGGFKWDLAGGTLVAASVCWDRDFFVGSGGGVQSSNQLYALATSDTAATVSLNAAAPSVIFLRGVMKVSTAGTFIVRGAQATSSVDTTTLAIGSMVRLTKVA